MLWMQKHGKEFSRCMECSQDDYYEAEISFHKKCIELNEWLYKEHDCDPEYRVKYVEDEYKY